MGPRSLLRRFELQEDVSSLVNDDVRPCDVTRRTWSSLAFHNYWLLVNCSIASFLTGSSLISLGLTWWQATISTLIGNLLGTGAILLSSLQGSSYHIGFSVYGRSIWGIWGAHFTIWNRVFLSLVWYGFQAWVGGQCVYLILLSWDPTYESRIVNTIAAEADTTSARFVCYVIFSVVSLPFIWIRPHRLQSFFVITSAVTFVFFLVLLIWALATMGNDGFGTTLDPALATPPPASGPNSTAWLMIYAAMSGLGSIAAGILNQSDFSRLAKKPSDAIWGQVFSYPVYGFYTSLLGILVVAATQNRFGGEAIWSPPALLERLLQRDGGAGTRAALFFAGVALCTSQLGSSVPANALAGGIDLASLFPRYVNIRRGAYITALVSPVVNPWRLVSTAPIFLTVVTSYGVFLAPMTGMMTAHYLFVCRRKLKVEDLYRGDAGSIYWYWHGLNWRAVAAWIVGVAPCVPGFIAAVNSAVQVSDAAIELYCLNYLYGYFSSAVVYTALHRLFAARAMDDFVRQPMSACDLQQHYRDRWDSGSSNPTDFGEDLLEAEQGKRENAKKPVPSTA